MNYSKELKEFINTGLDIRKVQIAIMVDQLANYNDIHVSEAEFNEICKYIDNYTSRKGEDYEDFLNDSIKSLFTLIETKQVNYNDIKARSNKLENCLDYLTGFWAR